MDGVNHGYKVHRRNKPTKHQRARKRAKLARQAKRALEAKNALEVNPPPHLAEAPADRTDADVEMKGMLPATQLDPKPSQSSQSSKDERLITNQAFFKLV